ncbi:MULTISPECIES: hypothetical protein [Methylophaga]|uniref:Uncharacterized protein n=1 Tax=Methylophaga marina TaxID=45495 RepID=A0ABP3CRX2_9GAMM|nr:hypothetical protein GCM10025856_07880 [Methylophaga marina]
MFINNWFNLDFLSRVLPAIIPGIGYGNHQYGVDVIMLGGASLSLTIGIRL